METNYKYTAVILKDETIQVQANENVTPKIRRYINWTDVFKHEMIGWNVATKYFNFESEEEIKKVMLYLFEVENPQEKSFDDFNLLKNGIPIDCIEIKNGLAYFKELIEETDDQDKCIEDIVSCYLTCKLLKASNDAMFNDIKSKFIITRKK